MPRESRSHKARVEAAGNLLQGELLQEKAANLGRLARRLEGALEALAVHEAQTEAPTAQTRAPAVAIRGKQRVYSGRRLEGSLEREDRQQRRKRLLADAGDALFLYVVQREVLGLSGTAQVLDDLGVPAEVRLCMAPRSVLLGR